MFAASVEYLLNNLLSHICICLLRFFKHNKLKKFFKWHLGFIIALVESFFDKLLNNVGRVCIVRFENLGCYPKITKF
jgi:hypothetical protein